MLHAEFTSILVLYLLDVDWQKAECWFQQQRVSADASRGSQCRAGVCGLQRSWDALRLWAAARRGGRAAGRCASCEAGKVPLLPSSARLCRLPRAPLWPRIPEQVGRAGTKGGLSHGCLLRASLLALFCLSCGQPDLTAAIRHELPLETLPDQLFHSCL